MNNTNDTQKPEVTGGTSTKTGWAGVPATTKYIVIGVGAFLLLAALMALKFR
jgi:hypothetical protein